MKQVKTTIILSAFAVVSLITALSVYYLSPDEKDGQNELIGEVFYPEFTDPVQAATLKLIVWDGAAKKTKEFDVQKVTQTRKIDGVDKEVELWALPDHNNYPVENPERLRETAGSVMNIERLSLASNSKEEHDRLGVFDPLDENAKLKDANQVGDRIILKDDSGNIVCDLIIGLAVDAESENEVGTENRELVKGERYYVRRPDQNETYVAELDLQITTDFSEWIDDDLLQVGDANLSKIQFLNYEVENKLIRELGGRVPVRSGFEEFVVQKEGFNWSIDDLKSETEELDSAPLSSLENELKSLTILAVDPKPEYQDNDMKILNADLSVNAPPGMSQGDRIRIQRDVLGPLGFIVGLEDETKVKPTLLSTNGELKVASDDGLVYHLFFGYDVMLDKESFEFAAEAPAENKDEKSKDEKGPGPAKPNEPKDSKKQKGKIMSVHVTFDPSLIEKPQEPVKPVPPAKPDLGQLFPQNDPPSPNPPAPDAGKAAAKKDKNKKDAAENKVPGSEKAPPKNSKDGSGKPEAKNSAEPKKDVSEVPKKNDAAPKGKSESAPKTEAKPEEKKSEPECGSDLNEDDFSPVALTNQEKEDPAKQEKETPQKTKEDSTAKPEDPAKKKQESVPAKTDKQDDVKGKDSVKPKEKPVPPGPDLNQESEDAKKQDRVPTVKSPAQVFEEKMKAYDDAMRMYESDLANYEQQMKDYKKQMEDYKKKIEDNRKRVADLNSRFADWFYIVDSSDLEKVKLTRSSIVKPKSTPDPNKPPTGLPPNLNLPGGIPNFNNLPGNNVPGKSDPGKSDPAKKDPVEKEGPDKAKEAKANPAKDPVKPANTETGKSVSSDKSEPPGKKESVKKKSVEVDKAEVKPKSKEDPSKGPPAKKKEPSGK